jgi:taurine--2-oxoglutarate transaminase
MTGDPRRWASEPGLPGIIKFWGPYTYRSAFHSRDDTEECARALAHLSDVIMVEGAHNIAAIVLETVVGTNGILVPPDGYLAGVRELCDRHGIVMIADEVMAGFGRCGEWFAVDHWDVTPDLICFAKGVNSGYLPLGGVIISRRIAATYAERAYQGGLTYSGHPLACASAVASINIFKEEGIVEHARHLGDDVIGPALAEIASRHPSVGEVRGLGVFWAIELVRDRATREPLVPYNASGADNQPMAELAAACKERGLWPFVHFNRMHVVPPLVITDDEMGEGLAIIDEALTVADAHTAA